MRMRDVELGVVYAMADGSYPPLPVVFLSRQLHRGIPRLAKDKAWKLPGTAAKPSRGNGYSSGDVGYPVFIGRVQEDVAAMEKMNGAEIIADGRWSPPGMTRGRRELLLTLGKIIGPWDEVHAEHKRVEEVRRRLQAEKTERDTAERAVAGKAIAALEKHGIRAMPNMGGIRMNHDAVTRLLELLEARDA